ncbi:peroxiredoxin [Galliscardovia ingluviei]|uniref:Peroxiredoxin n=1 Tax=Galliscardovia ingluviei TaxID=1769422 RepID=A0A8J3AIE1_9BIFI|nr:OsmC family protein [Galliscardovia ingluviei]GGI14339.1 peroxiredoxin [Galliscardovia ingluviei]
MAKKLWVERNKDGSWDARSEDGAHLKFGKGKGLFSPGELSMIALAACAALTSQFAVESATGEGNGAKVTIEGRYDPNTDSYLDFSEQIIVDALEAGLSPEDVAKLKERIRRHIDKACTVKHTYEQGAPCRMDITVRS